MITQFTLKGSFTCVSPVMIGQMPMSRKGPSTVSESTLERFLAVMDALVGLEVALFCETLAAALKLADERLFTDLDQKRHHKGFRLSE